VTVFEVEQKFPVDEPAGLMRRFEALGAVWRDPQSQIDHYLAHPCRDFAATDEALRVRRVGERNWITYKGPKLDSATKTRGEIELPLPPGPRHAQAALELFSALGFQPVLEVRKQRRPGSLIWQGWSVELALDEVASLGTFLELEIVAGLQEIEPARASLTALAHQLGLRDSQRRSYLEMLLEAMPPTPGG
jgi:adenylate cyclase class 2